MTNFKHEYLDSKIKRSLTRKLLVYILLFSAFFTILSVSFQLYLDYKRDVGQVTEQIELIKNSYLKPLTEHVWAVDIAQVKIILTSILNLPDVQYVEIIDQTTELSINLGEITTLNNTTHRFKLEYYISEEETVPLGYLSINTTLDNVYSRLRDRVLTISVSQAIKTFFVSLFIFLITYHLITRHLVAISEYAASADLNTLDHRLELKRKPSQESKPDELDRVVTSLNDMHARISSEIKERKDIEEQLYQSQKIESLGRLAGGVAHDFNNMLSVIIGNVELSHVKLKRSAPLNENLERILEAANRSRDITRQLLAFARKQVVRPEVINLNDSVEKTLKMLQNLLGENIDLNWRPKIDLPLIKVDPSQLDQVLANLCINARDAIADIGKMTIETDTASFDETYCNTHSGFTPGDYVLLSVNDNGRGMDDEIRKNIFEPFFTTKQAGEGTGLGMAMVHGIVKQCGGFINVFSELNQGTTFKIYLPRYEGKEKQSEDSALCEITAGQGETVLLVEDEAAVLEVTQEMLEDLGYRVLACNSPDEAITLLKSDQGGIHLILTDVIMPGMNGRDLTERILEIQPKIKSLYMSGYTADVIAQHGVLGKETNFIQKPFSKHELSLSVREALDLNA